MAPPVRREQVRLTDTIFALSSGRPPAAIGVIRVSGPVALAAVEALAGDLPSPRTASLRTLRHGGVIDRALVIVFPGPNTATGEDLVEVQCHGGRAVIAAVEGALGSWPGLRRAEPGEFTRRALSNGRIDLIQAEGLADLLEAETEAQRIAAMAAAEGGLSTRTREWLDRIAMVSARLEALLDHADEDDVVDDAMAVGDIRRDIVTLAADITRALDAPSVERLRDGVRVVIAGPPNAGKSTLLNLLIEREAAIVSPVAGTTRDRVEATVSRAGLPMLLVDTAGLTATRDPIEAIGISRSVEAIEHADVLLWLGDEAPPRSDAIWLHTRSDLPGRGTMPPGRSLAISVADAQSIQRCWSLLAERVADLCATSESAPAMREHQREACSVAAAALVDTVDLVLLAEGLAVARRSLARLLGVDATDVMLDALFSRFCIGK